MSFNDKKKADIDIINAIMNLMTTRQTDNEDLTDYTKCFKPAGDLCKEKYSGIFKITMLTQEEFTSTSDQESSYKTAYTRFLSILCLKNMDQMTYGSFIKKMAEDFATDAQHILSIQKYDQAYHDKQKSNETITTRVSCPKRMMIILLLGMYSK